jgi:hypothetical protein
MGLEDPTCEKIGGKELELLLQLLLLLQMLLAYT